MTADTPPQNPEPAPQKPPAGASPGILVFGGVTLLAIIFGLVGFAVSQANNAPPTASSGDAPGGVVIADENLRSDGVVERDPAVALAYFELTDQNGALFTLDDLRDRHSILYFGYTFCPDFCPTTLLDLRLVSQSLGPAADQVNIIMVSVDPNRDTPELLGQYMSRFDPSFIGLTGTPEALTSLADQFGAFFQSHQTPDSPFYMVDHTATMYLIDPQGRIVAEYRYGTAVETITRDLRRRLGLS